VIAVVVAVTVVTTESGEEPRQVTSVSETPSRSATFPLATRAESAIVWTGHEIVVWGGDIEGPNVGLPELGWQSYADGAAFDPGAGTWRTMAPGPLPATDRGAKGAWASGRVVLTSGRHVAAWDPQTDTWLAFPELPREPVALASTGGDVIIVGPDVVVDPTTGTWRALPPPPAAVTSGEAFWTGSEVIALGATQPPSAYQGDAVAYAYDPANDTWRSLSEPRIGAQSFSAAWTGEELVAVDYHMHAVAYDPANDTWRELPDVPARQQEGGSRAAAVGERVLVEMNGTFLALDGEHRWSLLPQPESDLVWPRWFPADERLWQIAINPQSAMTVLLPFGFTDAGDLQIGAFAVAPPAGMDAVDVAHDRGADGHGNDVVVRLEGALGACTLRASHAGTPPAADHGELLAQRSSDFLVARCDPPDLAALVAGGVRTPTFG
jgi:hypothetical protein